MDAEVAVAGNGLGIEFNFDLIAVTPNTRLAHRLMLFAQAQGDTDKTRALMEGLFLAYFTEGRDIGSLDVLIVLSNASGFDPIATRIFLSGTEGTAEVVAAEAQGLADGIRSLPTVRIDGTQVSGAQPATVLADALRCATAKRKAGSNP
jgi:predicted DsbA family dithiol-disulfide isomerase